MRIKHKHFKFKFRDRKKHHTENDLRIVFFDLKQMDGYSDVAKSLFIHCVLEQLRRGNGCKIYLERDLQIKVTTIYKSLDAYTPRDTDTRYLKNMMIDWFSNCVNCSFIDGWRTMLNTFEIYKQTMDNKNNTL